MVTLPEYYHDFPVKLQLDANLDVVFDDHDQDGIPDQQDWCPESVHGQAVNSRGCDPGL